MELDSNKVVEMYVVWLRDVKFPTTSHEALRQRIAALECGVGDAYYHGDQFREFCTSQLTRLQAWNAADLILKQELTSEHVAKLLKDVPTPPEDMQFWVPTDNHVDSNRPIISVTDVLASMWDRHNMSLDTFYKLVFSCLPPEWLAERPDTSAVTLKYMGTVVIVTRIFRSNKDSYYEFLHALIHTTFK